MADTPAPTPRAQLLSKLSEWLPQTGALDPADKDKQTAEDKEKGLEKMQGKTRVKPVTVPVYKTEF